MTATVVMAVITTYRPDPSLSRALAALRGQVAGIIVVDDGSGPVADGALAQASEEGAHVLRLDQNSGIAAALNVGIEAALKAGADAIVTFDQDSFVPPGFINALVEARDRAKSKAGRRGPVVPEYFANVSQVHHVEADGTLIARHAIQSGMLIDRELLRDVGLMREDFFIDLVDTEFELRCRAAGRSSVAAPELRLAHSLGQQYERRVFGRVVGPPFVPPVVTLSTPFRYYYRVRNRIVLNKLFWHAEPRWILRDTVLEVIHYVNALALARPRWGLWSVYWAAMRDARRERMGRISPELEAKAASISWGARPVE